MKPGDEFNPYKRFRSAWCPNVVMRLTVLGPAEKLVFARLLQYAGTNGLCWPAQETLARETGLHRTTVQRALGNLLKQRLIAVRRKPTTSSTYVFLWHEIYEIMSQSATGGSSDSLHPMSHSAAQRGSESLHKENHRRESVRSEEQPLLPFPQPKPMGREVCPVCGGIGAVRHQDERASWWVRCETCQGTRVKQEREGTTG